LNILDRFSKNTEISNFILNPSSRSRVPYGRTVMHDEASSRFSQFCERTYKPIFVVEGVCVALLLLIWKVPATKIGLNLFLSGVSHTLSK